MFFEELFVSGLKSHPLLKLSLLNILLNSKNSQKSNTYSASNAITLLCAARYPLSNLDLSEIKLDGA